jgi:hypothetical protein
MMGKHWTGGAVLEVLGVAVLFPWKHLVVLIGFSLGGPGLERKLFGWVAVYFGYR